MAAPTAPAQPAECVNCGEPATTSAYGEPFCEVCLCPDCEHVHTDSEFCVVPEAEDYDRNR
jgi:hypothetical protein